jgi:hypothetical protein
LLVVDEDCLRVLQRRDAMFVSTFRKIDIGELHVPKESVEFWSDVIPHL